MPSWASVLLRITVLAMSSIGATIAFWASLPALVAAPGLSSWVATPAQLERVADSTSSGGKGSTPFLVDVRYQYHFGDRRYTSTQLALDGHLPSTLDYQRERYRVLAEAQANGLRVTAYVNPENPQQAVLTRSVGAPTYFVALIGFALLIVLAVSIWAMWPRRNA